ncbi:hypothetical protein J2S00_001525 [Caldalkalibacillus uzonensis]|uniref:Uncharacterized protein n=1 Tax=Caldalkalibacillus uzonensis TaxID=353224 RepID=A0ABU0CQP9_9BACI|nr:hypothetical protein [Caldalkalibacillus uzonensis]MDQ0338739.1 hypothetical protein [Caldalkalibacillus uzonensis]
MDRALVKEITKLVISKLEETAAIRPLTAEEIRHWNEITCSMSAIESRKGSVNKETDVRPLTDQEIRHWNKITASM